ncbi:glycosyltransferase family 39 protein [uncultured Microbacterium sp.]|uniref:glycosyltransferase family 39 protein n=1 Tax=uncultured Microbacterium sp. TaxID=191216 RepID=UPI002600A727|nr:glycosyltransferase family 39 protein [uncultured Microbacterium sp.]
MSSTSPAGLWRITLPIGVIGALLGVAGSWIPSFWGDEAASVMSASRSWPSLWGMLQHVDGVHGAYYAFLHVWIGVFGAGEFAVRLPSAIAAGFLAAGTALLAGRFGGPRAAVTAGLIACLIPRTVLMAAEGRSYAIGSAIAVWLTVLLVLLRERPGHRWAWAGYALGVAASIYVFLYLALLVAVHGLFVLLLARRRLLPWAAAAAAGVALAAPVIVLAAIQRDQIGFLSARDYLTPLNVLALQWFDPVTAWPCLALLVVGVVCAVRDRRIHPAESRLAALCLIWVALPTGAILLASVTIAPMYTVRYLSFCTPAAAILVALGVLAIARAARRLLGVRTSTATGVLLAVLLASFVPNAIVQRMPFAKDDSDGREAAAYLQTHARAGSAVVFDDRPKNSEQPRLFAATYPHAFRGLRDPALLVSFRERTGLWDRTRPNAALGVADLGPDVWALERGASPSASPDVRHLESLGYRVVETHRVHVTTILHLTLDS